jgi:uncharacterized protein with FMN-binding domain
VRRGSALGVATVSCAALVTAWRVGAGAGTPTAGGAQVVSPAQLSGPTASSSTTSRAATPSSSRKGSTASPSPSSVRRTIDGGAANTQYGTVQVRVVVVGHKLVDVTALHLTDSSSRSVSISAYAAPILRREALAAQSAKIDTVSGASYTSEAYMQSLQSALDLARRAG